MLSPAHMDLINFESSLSHFVCTSNLPLHWCETRADLILWTIETKCWASSSGQRHLHKTLCSLLKLDCVHGAHTTRVFSHTQRALTLVSASYKSQTYSQDEAVILETVIDPHRHWAQNNRVPKALSPSAENGRVYRLHTDLQRISADQHFLHGPFQIKSRSCHNQQK